MAGCAWSTRPIPIALIIEQAGGAGDRRRRPHSRHRADGAAPAHAARLRLGGQGGSRRALLLDGHVSAERSPLFGAGAACSRAFSAGCKPMSVKHPIIAVTGSSGAGTTSVKRHFEHIFRREEINAAYIEGDAFHRYDREEMREAMKEAAAKRQPPFQPFRPRRQSARGTRSRCSRTMAQTGGGDARTMCMTWPRPSFMARRPAPSRAGATSSPARDLLFYEGLHGACSHGDVNVANHADLKIGVVPVINLEWIQKLIATRRARLFDRSGDGHDPAAHARLRPLHLPAVHRDRHQLPARADGRHLEPVHRALDSDARRIDGGDPLPRSARHRLSRICCR